MKKISFIIFFIVSISSVFAQDIDRTKAPLPGPVPQIKLQDPSIFKLKNGITVIVVSDAKVPQISADYSVDAGPMFEGDKAGITQVLSYMIQEGTQYHSKAIFDLTIDQIGASYTGNSITALDRYFESAFSLFAEAIQKPLFTQNSFQKIQSQLITIEKTNQKDGSAISKRAQNALLYGKNHPNGEFVTVKSLSNLSLEDVKNSYGKYYSPSRGILTFIGDITLEQAKKLAEKYFAGWKGATIQLPHLTDVPAPDHTQIDLIDFPNMVQSVIKVTNLVHLEYNNPDFFPVILANSILGEGAEGRLFKNLREKRGFTYGAYSDIDAGRWQTAFTAGASVRNDKTDSAVVEILNEIKTIRNVMPTIEELNIAKAYYNGQFALNMENPAVTAGFARNILVNNLPKDFYKTYLKKINAVSPADILRVAKKYFNYDNTHIIIVGKSADYIKGLEALHFPMYKFDSNIDTAKTVQSNISSANAKAIVQKYLDTIGGVEKLKAIKSLLYKGTMQVQGVELNYEERKLLPNWDLISLSMGGNVVMKNVFKGDEGYESQMGQKKELTAKLIQDKNKDDIGIIEELYYTDTAFHLGNVVEETLNDKPVYKIEIHKPSGKLQTIYFDKSSNLLVKSYQIEEDNGSKIETTIEYADYQLVQGILFPFSIITNLQTSKGGQELPIKITSITLNEDVNTSDFK